MKYVYGLIAAASFSLFIPGHAFAETSCECPKLGCDPCSVQESIKFYTEKCGPADSKVKSCARPRCIPVEQATNECPVPPQANSGPRPPIVVKSVEPAAAAEPAAKSSDGIGKVKVIHGSVSIVRADGQKSVITDETDLHEGDAIESAKDGTALVGFNGGNKLHVHPDTTVVVKEYKNQEVEASRRALLQLIKGKIRNQVEQKYNGKTSSYRVETRAAMAGVRGTDFVIEENENSRLETKVETLRGHVVLSDLEEKDKRDIMPGEGAHFTAEISDLKHGILSPVYKIPADQMKNLDRDSRVDLARRKTHQEKAICDGPKGMFNQCAWNCMNNPRGESKCRVDLPKVACVRQRCNANGVWAEETRLPEPDAPMACPGTGFLVKDCDY